MSCLVSYDDKSSVNLVQVNDATTVVVSNLPVLSFFNKHRGGHDIVSLGDLNTCNMESLVQHQQYSPQYV